MCGTGDRRGREVALYHFFLLRELSPFFASCSLPGQMSHRDLSTKESSSPGQTRVVETPNIKRSGRSALLPSVALFTFLLWYTFQLERHCLKLSRVCAVPEPTTRWQTDVAVSVLASSPCDDEKCRPGRTFKSDLDKRKKRSSF